MQGKAKRNQIIAGHGTKVAVKEKFAISLIDVHTAMLGIMGSIDVQKRKKTKKRN